MAYGGSWVADKGQTKINFSHFNHQNNLHLPNVGVKQKLHDQYSGVLLEYGATKALTLSAKTSHSRLQSGPRSTRIANNETQLGLMFNASKLASRLLPPYFFRLTKSTFPRLKLHREKRASLHIGSAWRDDAQNGKASRFTTIAMADKVSAGNFHLMQEVESRETRHTYGRARYGHYRFSFGYHGWQIGSQAE